MSKKAANAKENLWKSLRKSVAQDHFKKLTRKSSSEEQILKWWGMVQDFCPVLGIAEMKDIHYRSPLKSIWTDIRLLICLIIYLFSCAKNPHPDT